MSYRFLKKARLGIALVFFTVITATFLDSWDIIDEYIIDSVTFLQFIPSLAKFVGTFSLLALGFLAVLVITVLFGRVYCSTICPLGVYQDFISRISKKLGKKKKFKLSKPKNKLRYGVLLIVSIVFVLGSVISLIVLDPFSIFGRFISAVIQPVFALVNNLLAMCFNGLGYYFLQPETIVLSPVFVIVFAVLSMFVVTWMAFYHGRLYCNSLCPVGALLGLVSKFSLFQIRLDSELCTNCGDCSIVCKACCIDIKRKSVDFSRCVGCFNCIHSCPQSGARYGLKKGSPNLKKESDSDRTQRRKVLGFLAASVAGYIGAPKLAKATQLTKSKSPSARAERQKAPITPPGSISRDHFQDACTACQLCVSVCPTNVLQPSQFEYGLLGIMQPRMDFNTSFCNYDCTRCSEVCPSGAILPLAEEEKKLTQIGKVEFVLGNCIVHTDGTACGACSEHCPTQAVRMVPHGKGLTLPQLDQDICIGCGACEYACPVRPHKAIYVVANSVHQAADAPKIEELAPVPATDEFPF